jgi:hypothetical protein
MPKDVEPFIQFLKSKNFKAEFITSNRQMDLYKLHGGIVGVEACCWNAAYENGNLVNNVFHPQKLNPYDAKVIFNQVDYVMFNGMKDSNVDGLKNILLLDS